MDSKLKLTIFMGVNLNYSRISINTFLFMVFFVGGR